MRRCVLCVACVLLWAVPVRAQVLPVGDALEEYVRLLQLQGLVPPSSLAIRPLSTPHLLGTLDPAARHPWAHHVAAYRSEDERIRGGMFDPEVSLFWNSARPSGANDGAVWQGRGATAALTTGAFVRLGPLSFALRPRVIYTQNRPFDLWPGTSYAYPLRGTIDLPQRFGPDPYTTLEPGQSYARLDAFGLAVGVSTENMWWGPGTWNAIVMSNNAPGFPHAFVGTSRPVDVWVGRLQGRWIWGELRESAYFDDDPENDRRFMTGIALDLQPRWVPGLSVGGTRVFTEYMPDRLAADDYLLVFQNIWKAKLGSSHDQWGFDHLDQVLSLYARWVLPESGFEIYGEYGRGDHSADVRDLVVELEHGGGYTIGLQKLFGRAPRRQLRLAAEITRLEAARTSVLRTPAASFFYVHSILRQGYTQGGQVIGAGIGPGANAQSASLDLFAPWGRIGWQVQRIAYDVDRYYARGPQDDTGHEIEYSTGLRGRWFIGGLELEGSVGVGRLLNRHYIVRNDQNNVHVGLTLRHTLMGYR